MSYRWWSFVFLIFIVPAQGIAQMQPHRAEYVLRLGVAANAPRIGTAVRDITLDCKKWHVERSVRSEVTFTPSLKISFSSKLDADESIDGKSLRYHATEVQNGMERIADGTVQKIDGELRAVVLSPDGAVHVVLPPPTLMPVAAIDFLINQLNGGATSFQRPVFEAEATGEALSLEVKQLRPDSIRPLPPAIKPLPMPTQKFWPISVLGKRTAENAEKPLFTLRARIFESGVIDRLTVDAGIATITADLEALQMHRTPICTKSAF